MKLPSKKSKRFARLFLAPPLRAFYGAIQALRLADSSGHNLKQCTDNRVTWVRVIG